MSIENENVARDAEKAGEFYAASAAERVPGELDDKILALAATEAGRGRLGIRFLPWRRPVAVAATITLSLAFVLETTKQSLLDTGPPASDAAVEPSTQAVEGFNSAAEVSSNRMRALGDNAVDLQLQGTPDAVTPSIKAGDDSACTRLQRRSAERWRQCIDDLYLSGQSDTARSERERFREAYPNLPLPAEQ